MLFKRREEVEVEKTDFCGLVKTTVKISGIARKTGKTIEDITRSMQDVCDVKSKEEITKHVFFQLGTLNGMREAGAIQKKTEEALAEMVLTTGNTLRTIMGVEEKEQEEAKKECGNEKTAKRCEKEAKRVQAASGFEKCKRYAARY